MDHAYPAEWLTDTRFEDSAANRVQQAADCQDPWEVLPAPATPTRIILSFDIEEHHRIEAAAGMTIPKAGKVYYRDRLDLSTGWLLDELDRHGIKATFFIVAQIARHNPRLVRAIGRAGHEVASHSWKHSRINNLTPATFREDVRKSKDILEQVAGQSVVGYRAPTFSVVRQTAWALDELAELGMVYDSSIYPVRHDRYGVPEAPRAPFLARGHQHRILEFPPATLRILGLNFPMGGGGYFRLFPLCLMRWALRQVRRQCQPPVAMLYFHPWEFDPEQARLPLGRLSRFRTYVGIKRTWGRLQVVLDKYRFARARDVAKELDRLRPVLPSFDLGEGRTIAPTSGNGVAQAQAL